MHTTLFDFLRCSTHLATACFFYRHLSCFAFPSSLGRLHSNQKFSTSDVGPRWPFHSTKKFGSIVLLALDVGTIPHSRFMFVILFAAFLVAVQVTLFLACLLARLERSRTSTLRVWVRCTTVGYQHPDCMVVSSFTFRHASSERSAFLDFGYLYASHLALYLLLSEASRFSVGGSNTLSTCWLELDGSDVGDFFPFSQKISCGSTTT
jgi:hypothetical protein